MPKAGTTARPVRLEEFANARQLAWLSEADHDGARNTHWLRSPRCANGGTRVTSAVYEFIVGIGAYASASVGRTS
ncbi:hypothetical protein ACH40F_48545 [Streptomyces sp. NPDC020794]|uniref:hypothetical protein n=1 Tax=unclassified Streptomyces TaxID=2593676 RepID=UPI0036E584D8